MARVFDSKQELREDLEKRTDPEGAPEDIVPTLMHSPFFAGLLSVRSGISILKDYVDSDREFPSERHKEITQRVMSGMGERMTAFEIELTNAIVELSWEVNNCECDHCKKMAAEAKAEAIRANAKNN
jgi:hypothetical protein